MSKISKIFVKSQIERKGNANIRGLPFMRLDLVGQYSFSCTFRDALEDLAANAVVSVPQDRITPIGRQRTLDTDPISSSCHSDKHRR